MCASVHACVYMSKRRSRHRERARETEREEMAIGLSLCRCKQCTNMVKEVDLRKPFNFSMCYLHNIQGRWQTVRQMGREAVRKREKEISTSEWINSTNTICVRIDQNYLKVGFIFITIILLLSETLTRMWAQVCVMFVYVWQKILFHVMTCVVWYIWIWVVFNRAYPRAHIEPHSTSTVNKMYLNISRIALPSVQCETMPSQWKYFTRYKSAIIINRKILSKIHKIHKDCDANSVHYDF